MKVLFIGGTGNISASASRYAVEHGIDLYLCNRGSRPIEIDGAESIICDIKETQKASEALDGHTWDVVVDWIAYDTDDIERDYELFAGKTDQYIFISSASVYQKALDPIVTESTPLCNPYWEYSQKKIAAEELCNKLYRDNGFPITIVRPSLTYGDRVIPMAIGCWDDYTVVDRMKKGKKVIVHGDGTSLWTVTHADDFAVGIIGLCGHQQAIGQAFHITSDEIVTWDQIYTALADAAGTEAQIIHIPSDFIAKINSWHRGNLHGDKAVSAIFDNSKIKRYVPEFNAVIPFKKGIKRTVEWFEADPSRMVVHEQMNTFMDAVITEYEKIYNKTYDEVPMW